MKNKEIKVYLSEKELKDLTLLAAKEEKKISGFVRDLINSEIEKRKNEEVLTSPFDNSVYWIIQKSPPF